MSERLRGFLGRLAGALLGASAAGLIVAGLDARYAAEGAPAARLLLGELGLVAPVAFGIGVFGAVFAELLLPPSFPRVGVELRRIAASSAPERRELAARCIVSAVLGVTALVFVTRTALRVLADPEPALATGGALGLVVVAATAVVALSAAGAGALAGEYLPSWSPNPVTVGGTALAVSFAVLAALIATGTTSGAGGVLAVFGVFRRQELDLRAPACLLAMAGAAVLVPPIRSRLLRVVAVLLAVLPLAALVPAARSVFDRHTSLAVERYAPLGKNLLAAARRLSDRDHDGSSAWFGGGDCAEGDPKINPDADDIPGNGIDEDCSGADATASPPPEQAPPEEAATPSIATFDREHLPKRPNVVLITIDATRADDLGFMGNTKYPVSPNLDALAKKSVVFDKAYSLASYTSKSLAPMLIGRYGSETHRGFLHFNRFTREDTFVSERLQKAGIHTVSVQGHWYFFKNYGMERGYDVIDSRATPADQPIEGDRSSNGDLLSDRIIEELRQPAMADQQFFLWSHYIDPHAEYVPHQEFDFGHYGRERYDGEIAFVDHHLGRVLDALAKLPFADRTIVIITSDHGEAFGEHGLYRHGFELWEELIRVPLVFYVPGAPPHRVAVRRSAIDIVPTILDIYGLPAPPAGKKTGLPGVSLLPDLLSPPGYTPKPRIIFVDMPAGPYNDSREAYIDHDMKLIMSGHRALGLFDLEKDPGEKHDLLDDTATARPLIAKEKALRSTLAEVVERPK